MTRTTLIAKPSTAKPSSGIASLWTVMKKELRELSRDRRTLVLALVMGPLLTPALILGMGAMAESRAKSQIEKPLAIAMIGAERAPNLVAWLGGQGISRKVLAGDPDEAIRDQDEDVYLRIEKDYGAHWRDGTPALVEIVHDSTRQDADIPVKRVEAALNQYRQLTGALRLLARGINPGVAAPLAVAHKDLSTPEARKGLSMSILPYLLILSAFLGGAHLIIDATAGGKIGLVSLGSCDGAIHEAIDILKTHGVGLNYMRVRSFPFTEDVEKFLAAHELLFVVEQNRDAQFRALLTLETAVDKSKLRSLLHYSGLPISSEFIVEGVLAELQPRGKAQPKGAAHG